MSRPSGTEEWVYLAVLAGTIEVQGDGSVWRLAHQQGTRHHDGLLRWAVTPHRIDTIHPESGYRTVKAMIRGKRRATPAHRLVWRALVGPIPDGLTINHKNGDRADNRLSNLELMTMAENIRHSYSVLHRRILRGEQKATAKLTDAAVLEIRRRCANGERQNALAREFGVKRDAVHRIVTRKRWAHLGDDAAA